MMQRHFCRLYYVAAAGLLTVPGFRPVAAQVVATPPPSAQVDGLTLRMAAEAVLVGNPQLLVSQSQVDVADGQRMKASSIFNPMIASQLTQSWASQPLTPYQAQIDGTGATVSLQRSSETLLTADGSKLLRNGISLGGHFQLERLLDNIGNPGGNNFSTLSLGGTLPLLRNRGRQVVAAQESAARREIDATREDAGQEASQLIDIVASSYWALVASQKNLEILHASEDRAQIYRSNVRTLVDADQAPKGDLSQVEANLATRTSQRIAAEQNVTAAEQQLALDIGFSFKDLATFSLHARDEFPSPAPAATVDNMTLGPELAITSAMGLRDDYLAAQQRVIEQQELEVAARNGLLPRLDLIGSAGYSGLQSGRKLGNFIDAATAGVAGPNAVAQLSYSFPVGNELAKGQLLQTKAALRQAELKLEQLRQQISAGVRTSQSALRHAAQQVVETARAVEASQAALDGEREKYRVGVGSIVDLVTVEDRLNSALSDQVQAQYSFALAIAQLRFSTGTFIKRSGNRFLLEDGAFVAIPQSR